MGSLTPFPPLKRNEVDCLCFGFVWGLKMFDLQRMPEPSCWSCWACWAVRFESIVTRDHCPLKRIHRKHQIAKMVCLPGGSNGCPIWRPSSVRVVQVTFGTVGRWQSAGLVARTLLGGGHCYWVGGHRYE